jgi:hypothetical protein
MFISIIQNGTDCVKLIPLYWLYYAIIIIIIIIIIIQFLFIFNFVNDDGFIEINLTFFSMSYV